MEKIKIGFNPYLNKDVLKLSFLPSEIPHPDLFSKSDVYIGNPSSNIALGIIYTWKDDVPPKEVRDFVQKLSNYTNITGYWRTTNGARYIFSNICKNPNINKFILLVFNQNDNGHLVIDAIRNYYINGTDDKGIIISSIAPNPKFEQVPIEALERLKHQADLITIRNLKLDDFEKVKSLLNSVIQEPENSVPLSRFNDLDIEFRSNIIKNNQLYDDGIRFEEPMNYDLSHDAIETTQNNNNISTNLGISLQAESLKDALSKISSTVFRNGTMFKDQRNILTSELRSLSITILDPLKEIPKEYSEQYLKQYVDEFINGIKDKDNEFAYNYHDRIFKAHGDQPKKIVEILKKSPNTRRCLISLWDPAIDLGNSSPPCLDFIWCCVRDSQLEFHVVYRSHHLTTTTKSGKIMPGEGAFVPNIYALATLQEKMAKDLNLKRGPLILTDFSAHVYVSEIE